MRAKSKPKILVLGGGFGGLETSFYLRMYLSDQVKVTLVSDRDCFIFRPNSIYVPFGLDPEKLKIGLQKPLKRKNITLVKAKVQEINVAGKIVHADGLKLPYDFLVIATGAEVRPEEVPGLKENAHNIWTTDDMLKLRASFENLRERARAGRQQKVLFLIPPNNKCSGPLYEMVFMLETWLHRNGVRKQVDITWTTFEETYIQVFGPRLHEIVVQEFEQRGVIGYNKYTVEKVDKNEVVYHNGQHLPFDLLISFPPYVASTLFSSLPVDDRGFITTNLTTRQVADHSEIYAVGDASDFPVKQGFLAFTQSDAAAEHLAAKILGRKPAFAFEPNSMCVMEQFDKATFAQVPVQLTGIAEKPVEIRPESLQLYRVGSSRMWRLGKKMLGIYVPWRFSTGNPFHAGLSWRAMELGLKVMSRFLAR